MATPKSDSTTKVTQHSLPASLKPSNPEAFPTVYADNAWDVIDENTDAAALLGAPGQYTQHEINGETVARYGKVFATLADMVAVTPPDGYICYCAATGLHYSYLSTRTAITTLGKWRDLDGAVTYREYEWAILGLTNPNMRNQIQQTTERLYIVRDCPSEPVTITNTGSAAVEWKIWGGSAVSTALQWEYSTDGGETWTDLGPITAPDGGGILYAGASVQIRAKDYVPAWHITSTNRYQFKFDENANIKVSGNIMSLLYRDYVGKFYIEEDYALAFLFYQQTGVKDATQLVLPATVLSEGCYRSMFSGCTGITSSPVLPALQLPAYAYMEMFQGCTALTNLGTVAAMEATGDDCMNGMFSGCTALTSATLYVTRASGESAMEAMFSACDALESAAMAYLTDASGPLALNSMFLFCDALEAITVGWTTWPTTGDNNTLPTINWVDSVAAEGTFTAGAQFSTFDASHVPTGWTATLIS